MARKWSDAEFQEAWARARGVPGDVATALGMTERGVYWRRTRLADKGIVLPTVPLDPNRETAYSRPEAWSYVRERTGEVRDGSVVVFSDAHYWPGQVTVAHKALLEVIKDLKPRRVIANGDVFDGAKISRHDPHGWGKPPSVQEELEACRDRLHEIVMAANPHGTGCALDWNVGNHCARFDRYIAINASEMGGVAVRLQDHFPSWEFAWSLRLNGGVMVKHRFQSGGIHAGYNAVLKGGISTVSGHTHLLEVKPWADYNGRRWGVQTGSLAEPTGDQFEYQENNPTPACSGFAVLTFRNGVLLPPELCEVIGGIAYFRGDVVV